MNNEKTNWDKRMGLPDGISLEKDKQASEEPDNLCEHECISREYASQPFGTCLCCGKTIIKNN